jgi:hypothetical protein
MDEERGTANLASGLNSSAALYKSIFRILIFLYICRPATSIIMHPPLTTFIPNPKCLLLSRASILFPWQCWTLAQLSISLYRTRLCIYFLRPCWMNIDGCCWVLACFPSQEADLAQLCIGEASHGNLNVIITLELPEIGAQLFPALVPSWAHTSAT